MRPGVVPRQVQPKDAGAAPVVAQFDGPVLQPRGAQLRAEPKARQHGSAIGRDLQTRADLGENRRDLEHRDLCAAPRQRDGRCQPGDPGAVDLHRQTDQHGPGPKRKTPARRRPGACMCLACLIA